MDCPKCGRINSETAQRCDCGYEFPALVVKESAAPPEDLPPALKFLKTRPSLKKVCPKCHGVYPVNLRLWNCTHDGAALNWLERWTAGDLIRAKCFCSMREEDDSLSVTTREYRVLASVDENDFCVFKALELESGRERTLVFPSMDNMLVPTDPELARGFEVFAEALIEWTAHINENLLEIEGLAQEDGGRLFFVLDLEEGRRLAEVIRQEAPLPPWRACALARQIASGLGALHAGGMIHGGAAPKNILVTGTPCTERLKLLPLGLERLRDAWSILNVTDSLESTGVVPGDLCYFAPEQLMGQKLDARADLYSLGVVMYEMLTGKLPYLYSPPGKFATLPDPPRPIHAVRPDLAFPGSLEKLVIRCLEKDRDLRPANAQEVINEITQVEQDLRRAA